MFSTLPVRGREIQWETVLRLVASLITPESLLRRLVIPLQPPLSSSHASAHHNFFILPANIVDGRDDFAKLSRRHPTSFSIVLTGPVAFYSEQSVHMSTKCT